MYDYRDWTPEQQATAVSERKERGYPWHGPPHLESPGQFRIVTGTCFEHRHFLSSAKRMLWFEDQLLSRIKELSTPCAAWIVMPNHYHILVRIEEMQKFAHGLGLLHGSSSFVMNQKDNARGRRVWHRFQDRCMRSEAHYYTTLNYIHNNTIKHGYANKWGDWPYSSFHWYLKVKGREWLEDLWRSYPVLNYGDTWDI